MKKVKVLVCLTLVFACLFALEAGAIELRRDRGSGTLIRITPAPAKVCKSHKYVQKSKKAATCSADGYVNYVCANCGATKKETLDATGDHSFDNDKYVNPTCTQEGYKQLKCSTCGKTVIEKRLSALGHDFGAWKEASRTKLERKCSRCGKTETKINPNADLPSAKTTPTPRPLTRVTPTPKLTLKATSTPVRILKVTPTPDKDDEEEKKTENPKSSSSSSGRTNAASYESYDYTAQAGMVEVFTTSGKVNLRRGPGKRNDIANNVPKRGTSLGELLDSEVDAGGTVWYKIRYKNRIGWITSDYAKAVPGNAGGRMPQGNGTELSAYFLCDFAASVNDLQLSSESAAEANNDNVTIKGAQYVESVEVYGRTYTVFGVEVGMTAKKAKSLLDKAGLYCSRDTSNMIIFERPCTPDSISVNASGFDAYVELIIGSDKCVQEINLYRY